MSDTQTATIDETLRALMKFTPQQRVELAERLIESVPPKFGSPEIEQAWQEEIARRVKDSDEGHVELIPADEVHARIEDRLAKLKRAAE